MAGLYGIYIMHNERLRAGKEALAKHEMYVYFIVHGYVGSDDGCLFREQLRVMREGNNGRVLESETLQSRLQRPQ